MGSEQSRTTSRSAHIQVLNTALNQRNNGALTVATLRELIRHGVVDESALLAFNEIDLHTLKITTGQRIRLREAIIVLKRNSKRN